MGEIFCFIKGLPYEELKEDRVFSQISHKSHVLNTVLCKNWQEKPCSSRKLILEDKKIFLDSHTSSFTVSSFFSFFCFSRIHGTFN